MPILECNESHSFDSKNTSLVGFTETRKKSNTFALYYVEISMMETVKNNITVRFTADNHSLKTKFKKDIAFSFLVGTDHQNNMKIECQFPHHRGSPILSNITSEKTIYGDETVKIHLAYMNVISVDFSTKKPLLKQSEFINAIVRNYRKKNNFFVKTLDYLYTINNNWFLPNTKVLVYDMKTSQIIEEKCYTSMNLYMKYIFSDRVVRNTLHKKIIKKITLNIGRKFDDKKSIKSITPFIKFFNIDMAQFDVPKEGFQSFNQFFARRLKTGARCIERHEGVSSPADCRIVAYKNLKEAQSLWIKGKKFTISGLLQKQITQGSIFLCRLAPQDYHRFHSPVNGVINYIRRIEGNLITVHPLSVRTTDVLTENIRVVIEIASEFGILYVVAVGAALVGSIKLNVMAGDSVGAMDELGWFEYGGSTILLVFEEVIMPENLISINSFMGIETLVNVGDCLGYKNQKLE